MLLNGSTRLLPQGQYDIFIKNDYLKKNNDLRILMKHHLNEIWQYIRAKPVVQPTAESRQKSGI